MKKKFQMKSLTYAIQLKMSIFHLNIFTHKWAIEFFFTGDQVEHSHVNETMLIQLHTEKLLTYPSECQFIRSTVNKIRSVTLRGKAPIVTNYFANKISTSEPYTNPHIDYFWGVILTFLGKNVKINTEETISTKRIKSICPSADLTRFK